MELLVNGEAGIFTKVCTTLEPTMLIFPGWHYRLLLEQEVCKLNKMLYVKH